MKLYRLHRSCFGEYDCDNYIGLFKTEEGMTSFLEGYVKEWYRAFSDTKFSNIKISLDDSKKLYFDVTDKDKWLFTDFEYEVIKTDDLV